MTMAETYEQVLLDLARRDERVVVMTAENRAAIRGLPRELGARFVDVGICEQTMIGAAAGLALRGRVPVAHALATFLTLRAFEFIRTDVGIANLPVKLVGAVPGFLSDGNGPTHQALEDIALMRGVPHMEVYCPADEEELLACLPAVVARPAPAYIRFCARKPAVRHAEPFTPGQAEVLARGGDVVILTYGMLLEQAVIARALLAESGLSVGLVNVRSLAPFDADAVLAAVRGAALTVTIEDHFLKGGLYSILAELLLERRTTARVLPIALRDRWFRPGLLPDVLAAEGFTGEQIADRVRAEID